MKCKKGFVKKKGKCVKEDGEEGQEVRPRQQEEVSDDGAPGESQRALSLAVAVIVALGAGASPALAPAKRTRIDRGIRPWRIAFSNPNGIAVDEATGDVYVADIGTDTVYKFDANGNPVTNFRGARHSKHAERS